MSFEIIICKWTRNNRVQNLEHQMKIHEQKNEQIIYAIKINPGKPLGERHHSHMNAAALGSWSCLFIYYYYLLQINHIDCNVSLCGGAKERALVLARYVLPTPGPNVLLYDLQTWILSHLAPCTVKFMPSLVVTSFKQAPDCPNTLLSQMFI